MSEREKDLGGRPPKFQHPDDMREIAEGYFKAKIAEKKTPNKFGLCLALGFDDYGSLKYYQTEKGPEFAKVVNWCDLMISEHYAERLCSDDKPNPTGMIFVSKVSFPSKPHAGASPVWRDKDEGEGGEKVVIVTRDPAT